MRIAYLNDHPDDQLGESFLKETPIVVVETSPKETMNSGSKAHTSNGSGGPSNKVTTVKSGKRGIPVDSSKQPRKTAFQFVKEHFFNIVLLILSFGAILTAALLRGGG